MLNFMLGSIIGFALCKIITNWNKSKSDKSHSCFTPMESACTDDTYSGYTNLPSCYDDDSSKEIKGSE